MGDRFGTVDMGRKLGRGCGRFLGGEAGSPSNTMAWAETDRQDRQWSDSIGRTVLQTVVQKRFALRCRTAVCPVCLFVCLSVTLLYCGQVVGWIKMKLGVQVGLGPVHVVLDGDPAAPPPKGQILQF